MKVSTVFFFSAAAIVTVNAESFSEEDQAIWIDRHNYFRSTGLPSSAGNMRRIGWDADLATKAAATASECSTTTTRGVNVYQSSSSNSPSIIDEAIQQWVVETAVSTIKTIPQPGSTGHDVGAGFYNSYSQVVWSSMTSVGCATASCSDGDMVVCEYAPAGNDGTSAWYSHAPQGSECPAETVSSHGLCIEEGDKANDPIAPIPEGKWTYQVYPDFVSNIQSILLNSARDIAHAPKTESSSTFTSKSSILSTETTIRKRSKTGLKTRFRSTPPSSDNSSSETEDDSKEDPGTVKPSSDTDSTSQNEAKTPEAHEAKTKLGDHALNTTQKTELQAAAGGHGEKANGVTMLGIAGMYMLGVAAVAGIIVFVHYKERQSNAK